MQIDFRFKCSLNLFFLCLSKVFQIQNLLHDPLTGALRLHIKDFSQCYESINTRELMNVAIDCLFILKPK